MNLDILFGVIQIILIATTPLVFAAIGELVTEKTGVLNLGVEGIKHKTKNCIAVQFHPEAAPGPFDCKYVFDELKKLMEK